MNNIQQVEEEILIYHWYSLDEDLNISNSIKDFLEYVINNNIITSKTR